MRRSPATAAVLVVTLTTFFIPARALADDQGAIANTLFKEGQTLMKKGDYANACPKFEDSLKLAQKPGTQFNLADCYEKLGKTAAAWDGFGKVVAMTKDDPARNAAARKRADDLEVKLTRLIIKVAPDARVPGLEVTRDGRPIPPAAYDVQIPVDPATYTMEATAPGYKKWSAQFKIEGAGARIVVEVPKLEKAPEEVVKPPPKGPDVPPPPQEPTDTGGGPNLKLIGIIVGGAGAALWVTSLIFALGAKSKWNDAEPLCPNNTCNQEGYDLAQSARSKGNIAFITFLIGTAAVGTGVVLFVIAPKKGREQNALRLTPTVGPDGAGIVLTGGF